MDTIKELEILYEQRRLWDVAIWWNGVQGFALALMLVGMMLDNFDNHLLLSGFFLLCGGLSAKAASKASGI